jgi:ATP-dependent RNA helicase DDX46/PRP5
MQQQAGGKLELARKLAAKIHMQRNLGPEAQDITQVAAAAIMKGGNIQAPQVAVSILDLLFKKKKKVS